MHEKHFFAEQNVPWKMDEEASPAGGCGTRSLKPGSWSDWPRNGIDSSGVVLPTFLRVVLSSFATQSLQIALYWLRQGCLVPRLRA